MVETWDVGFGCFKSTVLLEQIRTYTTSKQSAYHKDAMGDCSPYSPQFFIYKHTTRFDLIYAKEKLNVITERYADNQFLWQENE